MTDSFQIQAFLLLLSGRFFAQSIIHAVPEKPCLHFCVRDSQRPRIRAEIIKCPLRDGGPGGRGRHLVRPFCVLGHGQLCRRIANLWTDQRNLSLLSKKKRKPKNRKQQMSRLHSISSSTSATLFETFERSSRSSSFVLYNSLWPWVH